MVYFAIIPIDISSNDEKRNSLTLMLTGVAVGLERNNNINNYHFSSPRNPRLWGIFFFCFTFINRLSLVCVWTDLPRVPFLALSVVASVVSMATFSTVAVAIAATTAVTAVAALALRGFAYCVRSVVYAAY